MPMHFIKQALVIALIFDEAPTFIMSEYYDYSNIFLIEYVAELLKHIKMNDYAIQLEKAKQLLFSLIYSLWLIE